MQAFDPAVLDLNETLERSGDEYRLEMQITQRKLNITVKKVGAAGQRMEGTLIFQKGGHFYTVLAVDASLYVGGLPGSLAQEALQKGHLLHGGSLLG